MKKYQKNNIGEEYKLNDGSLAIIVDGGSRPNYCTISYGDGEFKKEAQIANLRNGQVKNEYSPIVYGVGYIGVGKYASGENGKKTKVYNTWKNMLGRCYDKNHPEKDITYIGVVVAKEWHSFQNFAKWYEENYREFDDAKTQLDKDLFSMENKIYSPTTCCFIPAKLNKFLANSHSNNTTGYTGVTISHNKDKFLAKIRDVITNKHIRLGTFETAEEAGHAYDVARAEQCEIMRDMCINKWNITGRRILDNIK